MVRKLLENRLKIASYVPHDCQYDECMFESCCIYFNMFHIILTVIVHFSHFSQKWPKNQRIAEMCKSSKDSDFH